MNAINKCTAVQKTCDEILELKIEKKSEPPKTNKEDGKITSQSSRNLPILVGSFRKPELPSSFVRASEITSLKVSRPQTSLAKSLPSKNLSSKSSTFKNYTTKSLLTESLSKSSSSSLSNSKPSSSKSTTKPGSKRSHNDVSVDKDKFSSYFKKAKTNDDNRLVDVTSKTGSTKQNEAGDDNEKRKVDLDISIDKLKNRITKCSPRDAEKRNSESKKNQPSKFVDLCDDDGDKSVKDKDSQIELEYKSHITVYLNKHMQELIKAGFTKNAEKKFILFTVKRLKQCEVTGKFVICKKWSIKFDFNFFSQFLLTTFKKRI